MCSVSARACTGVAFGAPRALKHAQMYCLPAWPLPGLCPDLCLALLACLDRSGRINASASCPTPRHTHPQNHCRFVSRWRHLDTFLFGSGSGHFRNQRHIPRLWQICFQKTSFGHLFVEIWIKPFPSPHKHPQHHIRFCTRWHHSDTLLSRSGSSHFRTQIHLPKAIASLLPDCLIWTPFCPDLNQAIFESGDASPKP